MKELSLTIREYADRVIDGKSPMKLPLGKNGQNQINIYAIPPAAAPFVDELIEKLARFTQTADGRKTFEVKIEVHGLVRKHIPYDR